jgi:hypothetical protein
MTEVLKWVTAGLAIWGAVSILAAIFWGLVGRRIFRKPPVISVNEVVTELERRNRLNGRRF